MSASLVGSEMCIRDRLWAAVKGQGMSSARAETAGLLAALQLDGEVNVGSVSYTHLTLPTICSV
eukprot:7396415-Alexandrium_andersonii.AAC.1